MRDFQNIINKQLIRQNFVIALRYFIYIALTFILVFNIFNVIFNAVEGHRGELFLFAISLKIGLALISIFYVLDANRKMLNRFRAAKWLDQKNSDKADTYQNALELLENPGDYDKAILEKIYKKADEKSSNQKVELDFTKVKPLFWPGVSIILVTLLLIGFRGDDLAKSWDFFALKSLPQEQHKTTIDLIPGNLEVTRSSDVLIEIIDPEPSTDHTIFYRRGEVWREKAMLDNQYRFRNLDYSIEYYVTNQYATSDTFNVDIFDLPSVERIDVLYHYPDYTMMETELVSDVNGNIKAIKGTDVTINIKSNND